MFFYLVLIFYFIRKDGRSVGEAGRFFAHVGLGGGGGLCVDGCLGQGFGGEQLLVLST